jgi:hypothetical protein
MMSKLTQREIFQAFLDGKKICDKDWEYTKYIHLVDDKILDDTGEYCSIIVINMGRNWELYIETVSFFEALEAMKEGKVVKQSKGKFTMKFDEKGFLCHSNGIKYMVEIKDLDARWQILEGDNDGKN